MPYLSDIFVKFFSGYEDDPSVDPVVAGVANLSPKHISYEMINLATGFVCWWRCRERIVWRIGGETARYLSRAGLYFFPETPPASWRGDAIVIESESRNHALVGKYYSVMAYRIVAPTTGKPRYYFVCLDSKGRAFCFSIRADTGRFDLESDILDIPFLAKFGFVGDPGVEDRALKIIRFVIAASYYVEDPRKFGTNFIGGQARRDRKGTLFERIGKLLNSLRCGDVPLSGESRPTEPATSRPRIRLQNGKVVVSDAYSAH